MSNEIPEVVVYSKPNCFKCDHTERLFAKHGVSVRHINVMETAESEQEFREFASQHNVTTMPLVVVERLDRVWSDLVPSKIEATAKELLEL